MNTKSNPGLSFTLIGVNGVTFSTAGLLTDSISKGMFGGLILASAVLLFAGIAILRKQMIHPNL
ncbi:MAG: hypothetical protein JWR50_4154 [Mucilaginibacter sp.]|nr:hypothetical protein [Mucilaginibacter sp.]